MRRKWGNEAECQKYVQCRTRISVEGKSLHLVHRYLPWPFGILNGCLVLPLRVVDVGGVDGETSVSRFQTSRTLARRAGSILYCRLYRLLR